MALTPSKRTVLCLEFQLLGLENRSGYRVGQAAALVEQHRLAACNSAAAEAGLQVGMTLATAQTLAAEGYFLERDPAAEMRSLQQLALIAYRYTPLIRCEDQCLIMDIGASLRLFNGIPSLLKEIREQCRRAGYSCRSGIGRSPEMARLLCRQHCETPLQDDSGFRLDDGALSRQLDALPIRALDCPNKLQAKLETLGLHTLAALRALPNAALTRRFGREFADYLGRVTGGDSPPLAEYPLPREFAACRQFIEPVCHNRALLAGMSQLLDNFCQYLQLTQTQCQHLQWRLHSSAEDDVEFDVTLSAANHRKESFLSLTRLQLEKLPPRQTHDSFIALSLECRQLVNRRHQALSLFPEEQDKDCSELLDRLLNRLGERAVYRLQLRDEHPPEMASRPRQVQQPSNNVDPDQPIPERPLWLLPKPQPLRLSKQKLYWQGPLELLEGTERISGHWWHRPLDRDYRVARNPAGQLCWLYRQRDSGRWYLHGIYA